MAESKLGKALDENIHKEAKISQKDIFSEDGNLKFHFMISLENIVIIKVVTKLCIDQSIQEMIMKSIYNKSTPRCFKPDLKEVENYVAAKVSQLPIAKSVAKKLMDIVPIIGFSIFKWVEYHDQHVFHVFGIRKPSKSSAVYLINNICWSTGGKIDYAGTARNVLASPHVCLSDDQKYKLACNCCLEEEIATIAPNFINTYYLDSIDVYNFPMIYYWTAKITGDYTGEHYRRNLVRYKDTNSLDYLSNAIYFKQNRNKFIYRHMLKSLVEELGFDTSTYNGIPILYMCKLFSEEEKVGIFVRVINNLRYEKETMYSLLSNLNYEQQKEVLRQCSVKILCDILQDWLRRDHFIPIALQILDVIEPKSYMHLLEKVLEEKKNSHNKSKYIYDQYKFIFMDLWQHGSKRLKDYIFDENNIHLLERYVTHLLSWNRDMDVIEIIFSDLNSEQEKLMRLGSYGIRYCTYLMLYYQWELLELYIKYALFPQKCSRHINQSHIKERKIENYESFFEALNKSENFEKDFIKGREFLQLREIPSYIRCKTMFQLFSDETKIDYIVSENNIKWYFNKNCIYMKWFQKNFPEFVFWISSVCKLIEEDKYDLLYHKIDMKFPIV